MYVHAVRGFVLLFGVINSSLYVTTPRNVKQCAVTIDYNNTLNDTYPDMWNVMEKYGDYCKIDLRNSAETLRFKIRYVLKDLSHWLPTNEWKTIRLKEASTSYYIPFIIVFVILCCAILLYLISKLKYYL